LKKSGAGSEVWFLWVLGCEQRTPPVVIGVARGHALRRHRPPGILENVFSPYAMRLGATDGRLELYGCHGLIRLALGFYPTSRMQVEIAEEEPEDVAVRRYMKAVMQSGVINKVRTFVLRAWRRQQQVVVVVVRWWRWWRFGLARGYKVSVQDGCGHKDKGRAGRSSAALLTLVCLALQQQQQHRQRKRHAARADAPASHLPTTTTTTTPQLRSLRHKESKIETYKRKLQERAQARRLGIVDPTWDEFYGENSLYENGMPPFDDFFRSPDDDLDVFDVSGRFFLGGGRYARVKARREGALMG